MKKIMYLMTSILLAVIMSGCDKDYDGKGYSFYEYSIAMMFENAEGEIVSSGMECKDSSNIILTSQYTFCFRSANRPIELQYKNIEGNDYLYYYFECEGYQPEQPWRTVLTCPRIFGDNEPHYLDLYYVKGSYPYYEYVLTHFYLDGVEYPVHDIVRYYPIRDGNRVTVRLPPSK